MTNPFETPKRPLFITVLCTLTFIGSGWNALSNLFTIFTSNLATANMQIEQYSNMVGEAGETSAFMNGFFNSSIETLKIMAVHGQKIAIMQLVLSLLSLVGAILMFRLKRFGFYLYTPAQVLSLFVMPYFAGFSALILIGMASSGIFTLLFIILYAINLKHMR